MKNSYSSKLNKKEIMFCHYYVNTGNRKESAIKAGYKNSPEQKSIELLSNKKILEKIDFLYTEKRKSLIHRAIIGYESLAFGNISDSIKLLFSENLSLYDLEKMNLFNISEIKKPKEGSMEIKFFDRLRALEKLEEITSETTSEKNNFYLALEKSIENFHDTSKSSSED